MAMEARALVLDNNKTVIVDTFNFFEDRVIDNVEIRGALRREERQNYYFQEKKYFTNSSTHSRGQGRGENSFRGSTIIHFRRWSFRANL